MLPLEDKNMGLDQYLSIKLDIYAAPFGGETPAPKVTVDFGNGQRIDFAQRVELKPYLSELEGDNIWAFRVGEATEVVMRTGYWRKANAIHQWFVRESKRDDCEPIEVSRDDLLRLRESCVAVIAARGTDRAREVASEHLPPMSGFLFGTTEQDDWYYRSLSNTIKIIDYTVSKYDEFTRSDRSWPTIFYLASW